MLRIAILTLCLLTTACAAQPVKTEIVETDDGFQLLRDGEPYFIRGVGGDVRLELAAQIGANSIRTWGHGQLEPQRQDDGSFRSILDYAHEHGLTVCAGFWVQRPAHGFDYSDQAAVDRQTEECLAWIRKWKDHPAVLIWALGNETALQDPPEITFPYINDLAKKVKAIDPNRPIMMVTSGAWNDKAVAVREMCPDIDIWGINVYAGLGAIREEMDRGGIRMPYLIGEYGPRGHWESPSTEWEAPIEDNSSEKAAHYAETYKRGIADESDLCIGGYVFLWGQKQERTESWYGMFLKGGERTQAIDEMAKIWTGAYPEQRAPTIGDIQGLAPSKVEPGTVIELSVEAEHPNGRPLTYEWVLKRQASVLGTGGSFEPEPDTKPADLIEPNGARATLTAPTDPGRYRIFVFVRDDQGAAAYANTPFLVE